MDLEPTAEQAAFRDEVRSWLAENAPSGLPSAGTDEGFEAHRRWEQRLHGAGFGAIHWPVEYGGRGASPVEQAIFEEEYVRAGAPERITVVGHNLMGPTLMAHGTEAQRERWLPPMLAAEEIWSQGYSEPGAGSDLASVQTRAVREGDVLVVTGRKIWTSYGAQADWIFALVRTDPEVDEHAGLTVLAIDMDSRGVQAEPITQLDGHQGFAEVFFDGAEVPADQVIGAVDDGWTVAMTALAHERDAPAATPARYRRDLDELVDIVRARGLADDPVVRDRLADLYVRTEVYRHHAARTLTRLQRGESLGADASVTKLLWSHLERDLYETARELLGPLGEAAGEDLPVADPDGWRSRYWYARAATIYAGTSQIQRSIVGRRVLDLPKAR